MIQEIIVTASEQLWVSDITYVRIRDGFSYLSLIMSDADLKRLYVMDSSTISLFKDILKGVGRNPKEGKKKGGIKAHTIIKASENVPCLIRYSEAVRHDHMFLKEAFNLAEDSIITFDKAYVDYAQYEALTKSRIWHVTRLKGNAVYQPGRNLISRRMLIQGY